MKKSNQEKRSPLKSLPLRNPGQSIDEEIQRIVDEEVTFCLFVAGVIFFFAIMEWWKWYFDVPPQPAIFTVVTVVICAYTARKLILVRRKVRQLKQARDGEKAVGQYLEDLRAQGYRVLHDIVGKGFNIDHVLIGPAGVFAIETKTISKPAKGLAEINYDGEKVMIGNFVPDRDPIIQGKAQATWLRELLQESTGRLFDVRTLVLYPGWFIKLLSKDIKSTVLVLNPKVLPNFLKKSDAKLSPEDTKLITYHLSRYIRTSV